MPGISADATAEEFEAILDEAGDGRNCRKSGALAADPAPGVDLLTPGTFGILDLVRSKVSVRRAEDGTEVP